MNRRTIQVQSEMVWETLRLSQHASCFCTMCICTCICTIQTMYLLYGHFSVKSADDIDEKG